MWGRRTVLAATLAAAIAAAADAQERAAPATIDAAAWLAGRWVGGGPMGQAESMWSPPFAGQMVGHYTLRSGNRVIFYEMMVLDVHQGGLRLSVKHFRTDFTSWEPGDQWQRFEPRSVSAVELRFDGVIMRRLGPDRHAAIVTHQNPQTGETADTTFTYTRAPL